MRILSILAHPRLGSYCHAIADAAADSVQRRGHDLIQRDLYEEGFDPVLRAAESGTFGAQAEAALANPGDGLVETHRSDLANADGLLVVHPNWWGKPPAILAGWIDRVFVPGVAYRLETGEGEPEGLLKLRAALIFNTSDTPEERELNLLGDPLDSIWTRCILPYCGVTAVTRRVFGPVAGSTDRQRGAWLSSIDSIVDRSFGSA